MMKRVIEACALLFGAVFLALITVGAPVHLIMETVLW